MADERREKHRHGEHYTPAPVARLLAAFAVRTSSDLILDPACGDGRLLAAALERKQSLSPETSRVHLDLFGIDRSRAAVKLASSTGAHVSCKDFFDAGPSASLPPFDAVIGNPPYIRHEVMGAEDKRRIRAQLDRDRSLSPDIFWPRWSGRSDIYVFFFAHAARFLRPQGRLVFLTASSWLDAGYGAALREFLLRNFRIIAIIESAVESFFTDASINTAITVLEREEDERKRLSNSARFVQLLKPVNEIIRPKRRDAARDFARSIEATQSSLTNPSYRLRAIDQSDLMSDPGWGKHLRANDVLFEILERGGARMSRLSDLARVRFGVKTGANEFFYLRDAKLKALGDIASVRRGVTTGANEFFYLRSVNGNRNSRLVTVEDGLGERHLIERRYLAPVVFSLKEIAGLIIESRQTEKLLFHCADERASLLDTHALEYISAGERAGYDRRPTCAARREWYSAARGMKPAPILFPSKVGERWAVALNRARVFEDKKLYGIFPKDKSSTIALAALLNSTWARYFTESTCRQMTGAQAIADIDVAVAEQILIPDPRRLTERLKKNLERAFVALARRPALSVFEEIHQRDRRLLDELTLSALGFRGEELKRALEKLYAATIDLVRRRLARQ
ncbi:MAG TPA: N-6 DNA methylase [Blastocatellia bacterium]